MCFFFCNIVAFCNNCAYYTAVSKERFKVKRVIIIYERKYIAKLLGESKSQSCVVEMFLFVYFM